ncbi:MAG: type I methionyl aminopeptidase [Patescibacteria group bacterium]
MSIIKNSSDLERLRYSARILASCLSHIEKMVKPGVSAGELNRFAIDFINKYEAKPAFLGLYGYPYALITELNEEVVHGMSPDSKIIPETCVVSFDCGVNYKGLFSDMCILITVGKVAPETKLLVDKTREALWAGIREVKAGKKVGDIGFAVNSVVKKAGLGNVLDLGGHGLGYKPHDEPHILHAGQKGKGARLFENQVIAIEPMITLGSGEVDFVPAPGSDLDIVISKERVNSAHIEHSVLVTKKGYEVLTDVAEADILPIV